MLHKIKHRYTDAVLYECKAKSIREAVEAAVKADANLTRASLTRANLTRANLTGASFAGASLTRADLTGASFAGANLTGSNLTGSNLAGADLTGSNLTGSYLMGSNLTDANLTGSNLTGSNLAGADLTGAYLAGAKGADLAIARTRILPEGSIIGWKQCINGVIVKLRIPEDAKRSHAFGRKCRAEYADVLEVIGATYGISQHDRETRYAVGKRVIAPNWSDDWQQECAGGIHFYLTRIEAENH